MQNLLWDISKQNDMAEIYPKVSKSSLAYIASMVGLGFAEYYNLEVLYKISFVMSIITSVLLVIVLVVYVCYYSKGQLRKK